MKTSLTMLFIVLSQINYSQSLKDSSFNDVLRVEDHHIIQKDSQYLIDIPFIDEIRIYSNELLSNVIYYNSNKLSIKLFLDIVAKKLIQHTSKSILIITPNNKYYEEIAEESKRLNGCIEPITSNIYYEVKRLKDQIVIDSVIINGNQPELNFLINGIDSNSFYCYYKLYLGSTCCPRHSNWDNLSQIKKKIISFSKKNDVVINPIKTMLMGKEGEKMFYYSLDNLSLEQKLDFLSIIHESQSKNKMPLKIFFPIKTQKQ